MAFSNDALEQLAVGFVDNEQVANTEEALMGARDILAERFADDAAIREKIRAYSWKDGVLVTTVKNAEIDEKMFLKCITSMKNLLIASFRIAS